MSSPSHEQTPVFAPSASVTLDTDRIERVDLSSVVLPLANPISDA